MIFSEFVDRTIECAYGLDEAAAKTKYVYRNGKRVKIHYARPGEEVVRGPGDTWITVKRKGGKTGKTVRDIAQKRAQNKRTGKMKQIKQKQRKTMMKRKAANIKNKHGVEAAVNSFERKGIKHKVKNHVLPPKKEM